MSLRTSAAHCHVFYAVSACQGYIRIILGSLQKPILHRRNYHVNYCLLVVDAWNSLPRIVYHLSRNIHIRFVQICRKSMLLRWCKHSLACHICDRMSWWFSLKDGTCPGILTQRQADGYLSWRYCRSHQASAEPTVG